jgi:two-component system, OmpR family, response regulator MtrA
VSAQPDRSLPQGRPPAQVLIVLRNPERAGLIAQRFHTVGLVPNLAFTVEQALGCLESQPYELLIADESLDRGRYHDLVTVARRVSIPVVSFGTGSLDTDAGRLADDYVTEDADTSELVRRCLALVRISRPVRLPARLRWGPLELDPRTRTARWQDSPVHLTPIQFRILEVLVLATGSVVSHNDLARHIWGDQAFADAERSLAHVRRIRKKIEINPSRPTFLLTVRGQGFRLADYEVMETPIDPMRLKEDLGLPEG